MPRPKPDFHLLSEEYLRGYSYETPNLDTFNKNTKFYVYCNNDKTHKHKVSFSRLSSGLDKLDCPYCNKSRAYTIDDIEVYLDENELSIVDYPVNGYTKYDTPIQFSCNKCDKIHTYKIAHSFINKTMRKKFHCKDCISRQRIKDIKKLDKGNIEIVSNNVVLEPSIIHNTPTDKTLSLLDEFGWHIVEYTNTKVDNVYQCKDCGIIKKCNGLPIVLKSNGKGSTNKTKGCNTCRLTENKKGVVGIINEQCKLNNISILFDTYIDMTQKLDFGCNSCGSKFNFTWTEINRRYSKIKCPICTPSSINKSKSEQEVKDYITSIYKGKIVNNVRDIIPPYEIDIFLPERNIAIEFCGNIWHSTKYNTNKKKHYEKYVSCDDKNIRLITIFDDEWNNNRDICESRISNLLGISHNRVYARKCKVQEISNDIALSFCNDNHIQGKGQSRIAFGLYYDDLLVSVMTFSKGSVSKNGGKYDYELNRFCSLIGYNVIGGASKLFSYFRKNVSFTTLVSYCDLRWGNGNVYDKLGLSYDGFTGINYYYVGELTNWERKHRFGFRKDLLIKKFNADSSLTEEEIAYNNGLYRIYDCGHKRYILEN